MGSSYTEQDADGRWYCPHCYAYEDDFKEVGSETLALRKVAQLAAEFFDNCTAQIDERHGQAKSRMLACEEAIERAREAGYLAARSSVARGGGE